LDQAKEIIGKTVELEFKLPNANTGDATERKALAEKLYQDITTNPDKMADLANNRASENILYNKYSDVSLAELPPLYQNNLSLLTTLATGQLSQLLEGLYGNSQYYTENGELDTQPLNGFSFFRIIDKQS
jgi:hypothetical protein